MIEQRIMAALHGAKPGSEDHRTAIIKKGVFDAAIALGLKDIPFKPLPEGVIRYPDLTYGGKPEEELEKAVALGGHNISGWGTRAMRGPDFTTLSEPRTLSLVRGPLSALGLTDLSTLPEILERAGTFGLGEVPAEAGPYQRMADTEQPLGDVYWMAMKPITDSNGDPRVFKLGRGESGSWLYGDWANPDNQWNPENEFVFSVGQVASEA